jgi:hypothetical protein
LRHVNKLYRKCFSFFQPKLYKVKYFKNENITLHAFYDFPEGTTIFAVPISQELQSIRSCQLSAEIRERIDASTVFDKDLFQVNFARLIVSSETSTLYREISWTARCFVAMTTTSC